MEVGRMSKWAKFWEKIESGRSDNNIDFAELTAYLERLGWETASERTSHRYFKHAFVPTAVNIQRRRDGKAKEYQIQQIRAALEQYTGENRDGWLRGESVLQSE